MILLHLQAPPGILQTHRVLVTPAQGKQNEKATGKNKQTKKPEQSLVPLESYVDTDMGLSDGSQAVNG